MAESKALEADEKMQAAEEARTSIWIRLGGWLLRAFWGFLAGNAMAILYFVFAIAQTSRRADNSALLVVLVGMVVYPFIVGFVMLVWLAASALAPAFRRHAVQAVASLATCGFVALAVGYANPLADPKSRARTEATAQPDLKGVARPAEMDPGPLDPAKRAELERREKDYAYGDYVPRAQPKPAPYVPRAEPPKPDDDYSKVPEIHISRPGGEVLLTNYSTQVLRVAAALMIPAGSRAPACAELLAPDGGATGGVTLKPRQAITLRRRDACPGTEAAAVQLQVWNDQQQSSPFRLIHER